MACRRAWCLSVWLAAREVPRSKPELKSRQELPHRIIAMSQVVSPACGLAAAEGRAEVVVEPVLRPVDHGADPRIEIPVDSPGDRLCAVLGRAAAAGDAVVDVPIEEVDRVVGLEPELLIARDELPRPRAELSGER